MKANEAPENVYLALNAFGDIIKDQWQFHRLCDDDIEYTRTDAFIKKVEEFLNQKDDRDNYTIGYIKKHLKEIIKEIGL